MKELNLSRRSFVTGATATGAFAALGALAGCSPNKRVQADAEGDTAAEDWLGQAPSITDEDCTETKECDVLVIGAGTAGYFAACAAAEGGAKTILIEKGQIGNNIRSSSLGAVGTKLQKKQKINIDITEIVTDLDHHAQGRADMRLLRKWAENSGEAIDWYTDFCAEHDISVTLEWNMPTGTRYSEWPTGHGTDGEYPTREADVAAVMDPHIASFDGCEVLYQTPMQCLIVEDGRVVGAYCKGSDGSFMRINAAKGVVVATGGYAFNKEMFKTFHADEYYSNGTMDAFPNCTGDGIKALCWIGAQKEQQPSTCSFNRALLTADQDPKNCYELGDNYGYFFYSSQPFLRVDPFGARFHNESAPYDYVMKASATRPIGQRFWHQIWDGNWQKDIERFHTVGCSTIVHYEGGDHDSWPTMVEDWIAPEMESFVEAGYIIKADTLEELADGLFIDDEEAKTTFLATCQRQNENFDAQEDPDFGKEAFRLSELRTPPFYGTVKSLGFTLCTTDGIRVNQDLQPYGEDGKPIEGVYVVGNDQGGFYGGMYPNLSAGINAGRSATFGRMVGKALAEA